MSGRAWQTAQLRRADGQPYAFDEICTLPAALHEELFLRGVAPRLGDLVGWEFRGMNGGHLAPLLGIRRFIKGFRAGVGGPGEHTIDGYNLWARQTRTPSDPWVAVDGWAPWRQARPAAPKRHGFYKVLPARESPSDHRYRHAMLLDYGLGDNPWLDPARLLRDYLVQIYPDEPALLIGKAYVALGPSRVSGSHFVMERLQRAP